MVAAGVALLLVACGGGSPPATDAAAETPADVAMEEGPQPVAEVNGGELAIGSVEVWLPEHGIQELAPDGTRAVVSMPSPARPGAMCIGEVGGDADPVCTTSWPESLNASTPGGLRELGWGPDGTVYGATVGSPHLYRVAGETVTVAAEGDADHFHFGAVWSPEHTRVAWLQNVLTESDVTLLMIGSDVDEGAQYRIPLTDGEAVFAQIRWQDEDVIWVLTGVNLRDDAAEARRMWRIDTAGDAQPQEMAVTWPQHLSGGKGLLAVAPDGRVALVRTEVPTHPEDGERLNDPGHALIDLTTGVAVPVAQYAPAAAPGYRGVSNAVLDPMSDSVLYLYEDLTRRGDADVGPIVAAQVPYEAVLDGSYDVTVLIEDLGALSGSSAAPFESIGFESGVLVDRRWIARLSSAANPRQPVVVTAHLTP